MTSASSPSRSRAAGAILSSLLLAGWLLAGCGGTGGKAGTAAELTGVDKIFAEYVEATGGADAYLAHDTVKMTGTFSIPAMGLTARVISYHQEPDLSYTLIESDALGKMESGSDGETFWEMSLMGGARIKEGEERAMEQRAGDYRLWLHWRDYYTGADLAGQEEVEGRLCDKVVMTPKIGQPETTWFDAETHLVVKSSAKINNEMGEIPLEIYPSDYRDAGGILMPYKVRQVIMGVQEIVIQAETIDWGVEIPAGTFDLPDEIKALVK